MTPRLLIPALAFPLLTPHASSAAESVVKSVETTQPVCPVFVRVPVNPVLGFRIQADANAAAPELQALEINLEGTTRLQDIARISVHPGKASPGEALGPAIAETRKTSGNLALTCKHALAPGDNWFWISVELKPGADIDGWVDASLLRVKVDGAAATPEVASPEGAQRIGYAVRLRGDDSSKSYRIPGLVRTKKGSLLAVYDVRYRSSKDLPDDIDVGVSRSTDGGKSWEKMRIAMDLGKDPAFSYDGVGDPAILVDDKTGRVWIAGSWSHGNFGWNGSKPGLDPEQTHQFMLAWSDDDGRTWSKPRNITREVKDPSWRLYLQGPGAGICMKDGTLVFPAQYRGADGPPDNGKPFSTLIWSKDRGETWHSGTGVKIDTTEAQLVELADGSILINCRDNRGGSRTVAVTRDLGKTWQPHPTDRKALPESVCMASLLRWDRDGKPWYYFSNPATTRGRHSMTLKASSDECMTWPESRNLLYDSRPGFGYSCLAPADDRHVGVLYEGSGDLFFLRFPLSGIR